MRLCTHWQQRHHQLSKTVRLLQMWIAGEDEVSHAQRLILTNALRHLLRAAHQRGPRPTAHQAHAGPQIRRDAQIVAATVMQCAHSRLAGGVHAGKNLLRLADGFIIEVSNQFVGSRPGFLLRFADNYVQTDPVLQLASLFFGTRFHYRQFFRHLRRWLSPGEVGINVIGGNVNGRFG